MLKELLMQDLKDAMKEKDTIKKDTVQMVRAAILQIEKDKAIEVDDSKIIEIIAKEQKGKKDALIEFEKGGRTDLIEKTQSEIDVVMKYLPEQLSEEEVNKIIDEIFEEVKPEGQKDMGKVMKEATSKLKGKADMKTVSSIIRERLN